MDDQDRQIRDCGARNNELRQQFLHLAKRAEHLEQRLERVENSTVFRFLRGCGFLFQRLSFRLLPWIYRNRANRAREKEYANWVREQKLFRSVYPAHLTNSPSVTVIIHGKDPVQIKRTQVSVCAQAYPDVQCSVCTDTHSIQAALRDSRAEYVAVAGAGVVLDPDALRCWVAAMRSGSIGVYGDWDHVDAQGRFHTPRFTPAFSPELLANGLYWGRAFLARAAAIRHTNWPDESSANVRAEHDLALRLSSIPGRIERVPRILSHAPEDEDYHGGLGVEPGSPANPQRASIIICSRRPHLLKRCLASLQSIIAGGHEVVVVRHQLGSRGRDLETIADRYQAKSVGYEDAFHFGVMNQRGVEAASGSVLVFLNDDVYSRRTDWLAWMLAQVSRPDVGIAGALLRYPSGAIQHAGVVVGERDIPAHLGRFQRDSGYWPWLCMTREVSAVTGACAALRRSVWDDLGGFDLRFPVNFNDIDLCLRARKRGYRVILEARAVLIHAEAQTRRPGVTAYERELFWNIWSELRDREDPYFNPQLSVSDESIALQSPWKDALKKEWDPQSVTSE